MKHSEQTRISKFLSLVLRHKPETIGVTLDDQGWLNIDTLIRQAAQHNMQLTLDTIKRLVAESDKQRFKLSDDCSRIRANQGHSLKLDIKFTEVEPPSILFHGTAHKNLESIGKIGLIKGQRHHVHLTDNRTTAHSVGMRYGEAVILCIRAREMTAQGMKFYLSDNGVWLTDTVPARYIDFGDCADGTSGV